MRPVIFFHFRILSGFVGILAASAARRNFLWRRLGEKGGVWGEFGGKLAEDGGDSREIYFFDWRRVYNIYSIIYSASAEEKFLTGRGEYII